MSKPDWKDAPEWAMWLAQDGYGAWGWYEKQPNQYVECECWDISIRGGRWTRPADWSPHSNEKSNPQWRKTLEPRP